MKETMMTFIQHYGYAAVFISMMLGIIGLPIPIEFLLLFAGSIVAAASLHMSWLIIIAWLGAIAGMSFNYWLGRTVGIEAIGKITKYMHFSEDRLHRLANRFQKSGAGWIVVGYFVAGLRHVSPFIAGASRMPFNKFAVYAGGGGALWIMLFTIFGQTFGRHWHALMKWLHHPAIIVVVVLIGILAYGLKKWIFSSISHVHDIK